jgi:hypothetical protein
MGATSVTGVGQGMATNQKGPGNGRNYFVPQVNPHVVAAGTAVLVGGAKTITFPSALSDSETEYAVLLTSETANAAYVSAKTDSSSQFASFTITGTGTDNIMWMVVKNGYGLDVA